MTFSFTVSAKAERRLAFGLAWIAALFLALEDRLFPLADYHPRSAATSAFEWNSLKRDTGDRIAAWAKGRDDLVERVQHTVPSQEAGREVLRLNTLELQYFDLAASVMPMLWEITEDYKKALALDGEAKERFKDVVTDYKAIAEVSPKIIACRDVIHSDNQKLIAGLRDARSSEKVADALVAMTNGLVGLIRSARAGRFPHCDTELVRFEEAYGRLVARHSEVVDVLKERAEEQVIAKKVFHWFWVAVLLFVPWLPEKARTLKEVFA